MFSRTRQNIQVDFGQEGREITHAQKRNRLFDLDEIWLVGRDPRTW